MVQIVDNTWFNKENELYLPLAVANPIPVGGQSSPNFVNVLKNLCIQTERELLLNALGVTLYDELQLALADIDNPTNAKWKKLVVGDSYDDKNWIGLKSDYSLIAYRVYEMFLTKYSEQLTAFGVVKANSGNADNFTSYYKITNANLQFLKGFQDGYLSEPLITENFTDWYGQELKDVSLFRYLIDKKDDFPTWDESKFYFYTIDDAKNSFGL